MRGYPFRRELFRCVPPARYAAELSTKHGFPTRTYKRARMQSEEIVPGGNKTMPPFSQGTGPNRRLFPSGEPRDACLGVSTRVLNA